ncbi:histone deacetylase family protein [Thiocystis violacea]|uniref:histone deacetylase family protein n=1 Tax=Thiocystis violacea TaxID=13725 RepID=UPI0019080543|nr:histone deacetylase family protein [Thiocystis violacea]MBK1724482.1 deacetylase [Thiocystis violacea]
MNLAFISHQSCREHKMGAHHPECPERLHAIQDRMIASGMEMLVTHYDAPQATVEQLVRVHDPDYVQRIFASAPHANDVLAWIDGDTAMNSHTLEAALHSAGAAILAVDLVMSDKHHAAFCCVRPPGHHAGRAKAAGFCIFNNLAVGAAHALEHHGLERIAIVDFDVHHGDGTEEIFIGDERVLFCSSFQHPFYPGTGADTDAPNVINLPLPKLTDGEAYKKAVEAAWLPRLDAFAPQLIMISAGFDGHIEDDMAHFNLREPDYAWITRELHKLSIKHSGERVVSFLEGGYTLSALGRCVSTHIDELIGHL